MKAGKTIIGKAKPGYAKDKEFKILKVFQFPIGIIQQKMTKVDWGEGSKDMDPKHIISYDISKNEEAEKD